MHRRAVLVSLVAAVLVGSLAVGRLATGAVAQEATPAALATHPIVGSWHWPNDPANPADDSYGIFFADGSYLEVTKADNVGVGIGAWHATGPRSVAVLTVFQDVDPGPAIEPGTATFLLALTVDATGNALSGRGDLQTRALDGTVTFEASGWAFTADRVTVAPLPNFGAWSAGTPAATPAT
jgi:hypothetical protein